MKRVAITAMVCESEGDLCYHLHNTPRPMTDPKNTEDQELSLDQLKDAAGGAAFVKLGDIPGEATDQDYLNRISIDSFEQNPGTISHPKLELDKSSTKYNPGKGASFGKVQGEGYTEVEWT